MSHTPIDYDECKAATAGAVLLRIDIVELWIPRSIIDGDAPEKGEGPGEVDVAEWFATKEGLI